MGRKPDSTCREHWLLLLLQKKTDYISRFVHIILAHVHATFLCIVPRIELYLSSLRKCRDDPLCVVFVRCTAVDSVLLLDKMVIDRLSEATIKLTSAVGPAKGYGISDHSKKIVRVIFIQKATLFKKKKNLCTCPQGWAVLANATGAYSTPKT